MVRPRSVVECAGLAVGRTSLTSAGGGVGVHEGRAELVAESIGQHGVWRALQAHVDGGAGQAVSRTLEASSHGLVVAVPTSSLAAADGADYQTRCALLALGGSLAVEAVGGTRGALESGLVLVVGQGRSGQVGAVLDAAAILEEEGTEALEASGG